MHQIPPPTLHQRLVSPRNPHFARFPFSHLTRTSSSILTSRTFYCVPPLQQSPPSPGLQRFPLPDQTRHSLPPTPKKSAKDPSPKTKGSLIRFPNPLLPLFFLFLLFLCRVFFFFCIVFDFWIYSSVRDLLAEDLYSPTLCLCSGPPPISKRASPCAATEPDDSLSAESSPSPPPPP